MSRVLPAKNGVGSCHLVLDKRVSNLGLHRAGSVGLDNLLDHTRGQKVMQNSNLGSRVGALLAGNFAMGNNCGHS